MIPTFLGLLAAALAGFVAGSSTMHRWWQELHYRQIDRMGNECRRIIDDMDRKQRSRVAQLRAMLTAIALRAGVVMPGDLEPTTTTTEDRP